MRRAQILSKADADGPNWADDRIAEAFECRTRTVENVGQRLVECGFREALDDRWPFVQPLAEIVESWCVATEFPITVRELPAETTIRANRLIDGAVLAAGRTRSRSAICSAHFRHLAVSIVTAGWGTGSPTSG